MYGNLMQFKLLQILHANVETSDSEDPTLFSIAFNRFSPWTETVTLYEIHHFNQF